MGIARTLKALLPVCSFCILVPFLLPCSSSLSPHRCERGEQFLDYELQQCVNCTRCNATAGLIVLQPCDVHRDTMCGPLSKLIDGIHLRHQKHHTHHGGYHHHGVAEEKETRPHALGGDPQLEPFDNVEAIIWDWQAIALTMAVLTCIAFFLIIALYSMHQARQWRRLKENFDADVEELSARLSLMAANSQEKGEVLEPSFAPIRDCKSLSNRCMYLEQLLQVRKDDPHIEAGNVYIEESASAKPA